MSGHVSKRLKAAGSGRRLSARFERHHPMMLKFPILLQKLSNADRLEWPDRVVFDFDPVDAVEWSQVLAVSGTKPEPTFQ
jgi:hypothetical protein